MNSWQLIFLQSRANHGAYHGNKLPAQIWDWPQGTWFQKRRRYLREATSPKNRSERKHKKRNPPVGRFRKTEIQNQKFIT
jgi:hypothetical protein